MKKILIILGAIFLVLIFIVAAVIGYITYTGSKLDASSKAYVDESIPAIVSTWSKDELIKRASQQLRQKTSDVQVDQLFNTLSGKLGTYQSYDGAILAALGLIPGLEPLISIGICIGAAGGAMDMGGRLFTP